MLKKIILPVVLLIFAQQNFYASKKEFNLYENVEQDKENPWEVINNWVNWDVTKDGKKYPKLWWLWAILDNVPFQYGNSKIWKHGEAYYGLSNGIGFFFSFLNFGWFKVGIIDVHINVINLILDYFKHFIQLKKSNIEIDILRFSLPPIMINLCTNIHIISVEILNCIKIKLVAPLTIWFAYGDVALIGTKEDSTAWYITCNADKQISWWYGLLSPRIEINIAGIIDYFKKS